MARIRSSVLVSAISRIAAQREGAAYINRRGSEEAGAIFIVLYDRQTRSNALYEPSPQALSADHNMGKDARSFTLLASGLDDAALTERFEQEARFDPDFWIIELEGVDADFLAEVINII